MFYKKQIDSYAVKTIRELSIKEQKLAQLEKKLTQNIQTLKEQRDLFNKVLDDYRNNGSVIAKMYADALFASDETLAMKLLWKKFPAKALSADIKKVYAKELRELRFKLKQYEYELEKYRAMFPEAEDEEEIISTIDIEEDISEENPEKKYLSKEEWEKLSVSERNQLALNKYLSHNHSKAHIGKMYERYIGYLYEKKGYSVKYNGIEQGLRDLGIDLICRKNSDIVFIQCKNWSKKSVIYEKHIAQFLGSCVFFMLTDRQKNLFSKYRYIFCTSTQLDDMALKFAKELGVDVSLTPFDKSYPIIKCNINGDDKIYHLPFDQQYDKVKICKCGEFYASSVKEAEKYGFRRAKRWIGDRVEG